MKVLNPLKGKNDGNQNTIPSVGTPYSGSFYFPLDETCESSLCAPRRGLNRSLTPNLEKLGVGSSNTTYGPQLTA